MAAGALIAPGSPNGPRGRRKTSPITFGRVLVVVGVGLALVIGYNFLGKQTVSDRPNEMRTTQVILPPPPPPPPPPEPQQVEQPPEPTIRSEEHTSELQSLMRISYAVFCLK